MRPEAPLDVTVEELEALLEGVREALGEAGYQKLKAAIRTLSYVTELLENREATLQTLRRLLCRARTVCPNWRRAWAFRFLPRPNARSSRKPPPRSDPRWKS